MANFRIKHADSRYFLILFLLIVVFSRGSVVFGAIIMATAVSTLHKIVLTGKSRATQRSSKSFQYGVVYEERE